MVVGYFILKFKDWRFDIKNMFLWIKAASYLEAFWKNNFFPEQS